MNNNDPDSRLATMAAKLLAIAIATAQRGSDWREVERAAEMHREHKLFPRMTISMPHEGGAVHLLLTLNDPATDEAIVRLFEGEATAQEGVWAH